MAQKELVKQAKKNIRKEYLSLYREFVIDTLKIIIYSLLIFGVVGGSLYSFIVHIDMINGDWEYPYGMTEIILTGFGSLVIFALFVLGIVFAIISIVVSIKDAIKIRNEELEEEISKLNKENADESK